jgi:hypothetical protein
MKDVLASWEVESRLDRTDPFLLGSTTAVTVASGDRYILKRRSIPGRERAGLLMSLQQSGVPVGVPVRTRPPLRIRLDGNAYGLYPSV